MNRMTLPYEATGKFGPLFGIGELLFYPEVNIFTRRKPQDRFGNNKKDIVSMGAFKTWATIQHVLFPSPLNTMEK